MVLVIFVHFDRHVSMQRPGDGRMKKLTHQPEFLTVCKILNIFNRMILSGTDGLTLNLYTVPTHNKHIFVKPEKVCLLWEKCFLREKVLI